MTGRMHQIRVHLAASGWPIVGDAKYGQPLWRDIADAELRDELRGFTRQALHAWRLDGQASADGRCRFGSKRRSRPTCTAC